ncbi:MAG TPA: kelch repeat-containing protein [Casimicrobiaceae bacterium]|nr:kelch repeat-containing protein [Casimicrobiaceae bacterium]
MLRALAKAAAVALGLAGCTLASPTERGTPWSAAPSMHHGRAAHAVVAAGGALYALAGTGARGAPVLVVERFDGLQWHDETRLPGRGVNAPAAAVLGNRIYLIGGFDTVSNVPVASVHVYDTLTHAWSRAAPLPAPRGGHAAVVMEDGIHVIGGGNDRTTLADHDVYDPRSDTWRALPPLPRAEGSPAATVLDGRLVAVGGRSGPADFGAVDIYDPAERRWLAGPPIEPRGTAGAVVYCGALHVFGGESQARGQSLDDVLRLAPAGWQRMPPMPTGRNFARAAVLGDAVYVVGGSPTPEPSHASVGSAVVERYRTACEDMPNDRRQAP